MNYIDEKFKEECSGVEALPVFHSCDSYFFKVILNDRKLSPTEDEIFENERLLYLFYGRPAYKNSNQHSSKLSALLPVSFIIKSNTINDIKRIASFDTGAFKGGLYKEYMHPAMQINNFLLTPDINAVIKAICYFFGTNENYFSGIPKRALDFDPLDFEIECFYNLINGVEQRRADDRTATFEIQLEHDILLKRGSIEAVILPDFFLSSELVNHILIKELNAELLTYESYGIPSQDNYSHMLYLTKKFLLRKNYLREK